MSEHNSATHQQAFDLLCGKQIGRGMSRVVYECRPDPTSVVKVEEIAGSFQNIIEWETWQRVKDTAYANWFASCKWISNNGTVLLMERTIQAQSKQYPDKMPVFLCDFKRTNFGMSTAPRRVAQSSPSTRNRFVCHDYGTNLLFENGMTKRVRKVEWYDEE